MKEQIFIHVKRSQIGQHRRKEGQFLRGQVYYELALLKFSFWPSIRPGY